MEIQQEYDPGVDLAWLHCAVGHLTSRKTLCTDESYIPMVGALTRISRYIQRERDVLRVLAEDYASYQEDMESLLEVESRGESLIALARQRVGELDG